MSGGRRSSREPVKVVIISTHYVETDAKSFKSVVQKLTGKDSDIAAAEAEAGKAQSDKSSKAQMEENNLSGVEVSAGGRSLSMRDMSFKELDTLLTEIPPFNELWYDMID